MKLHRKHTQSKHCYDCENFKRTKYWDKYPKKCKCGGFIHHEVQCRGWDRTSFGWTAHFIKCDKCGVSLSFDIDIGWDDRSFEEQYWSALKRFKRKRIKEVLGIA